MHGLAHNHGRAHYQAPLTCDPCSGYPMVTMRFSTAVRPVSLVLPPTHLSHCIGGLSVSPAAVESILQLQLQGQPQLNCSGGAGGDVNGGCQSIH